MKLFALVCCLLALSTTATAAKITTTDQLVATMQRKYAKSWYKTATFVQKTTNIDKDGNKKVETWYEAMSLPGSLRIDFTPTKDGNGILFTNSQIYVFKSGKVDTNRPYVHPLMVLGFDIYALPQADVIEKLKGSLDLSRRHMAGASCLCCRREVRRSAFAAVLDRSEEPVFRAHDSSGRQRWCADAGDAIQ